MVVRTRREDKPTYLQKGFMWITAIIVLGSFTMLIVDSVGLVDSDVQIFTHILFSSLSAMFGFLVGNNIKLSM